MTDTSTARAHMVDSQIRTSDVTDLDLLAQLRKLPRHRFVPQSAMALAYADCDIATDEGRVLLAPRDLAKMVQAADIKTSDVVLDIAPGRGYSTAVMAGLADTVVGLESTDEAVDRATDILTSIEISNAPIVKGELKSGAREHGPFNVIFINGAVSAVPDSWFDQLANKGRLVCIIQTGPIGRATVYTKSGNAIGERIIFDTSAPILPGFERKAEFVF